MYTHQQLRREPESVRQKAYLLAALADFCVVAEDMEEEGDGSGESEGQSVSVCSFWVG